MRVLAHLKDNGFQYNIRIHTTEINLPNPTAADLTVRKIKPGNGQEDQIVVTDRGHTVTRSVSAALTYPVVVESTHFAGRPARIEFTLDTRKKSKATPKTS
jgi:hypothetical protein